MVENRKKKKRIFRLREKEEIKKKTKRRSGF